MGNDVHRKSLDINVYRKLNWEDIKEDLLQFVDNKNVTRTRMNSLFSNKSIKNSTTGKTTVVPSKYLPTDYFDLPANILVNQPDEVVDTTIGIFIFNAFSLCTPFKDKIKYINSTFDGKTLEDFYNFLANNMISKVITVKEFGEFTETVIWLGYFTELFMPGITYDLIIPNEKVIAEKKRLIEENKDLFESETVSSDKFGRYLNNIEKPLIEMAKNELKDNTAMRIYNLNKPSFGNNYKNSCIINGLLPDPVTGKYKINKNSYCEGVEFDKFDIMANKSMTSSVSRGCTTAEGGTWSKYLSALMQSIKLDEKGTDCKTKGYLHIKLDDSNIEAIRYNYIQDENGEDILLTPEVFKRYNGSIIKMRSPLFCKSKDFCNKCFGDMLYILGIKNVGFTASIATGVITNKNMKAMHDITIKPVKLVLKEDMFFEY